MYKKIHVEQFIGYISHLSTNIYRSIVRKNMFCVVNIANFYVKTFRLSTK